jgi:ribosomal protein L37AE/L43A
MIIKRADSKQEEIRELEGLLKGKLTSYQRFLIERELKAVRSGVYGEKDSAYYIDFYFGNSKNWAVIHDLRLEHKGQAAQIDHLLINRLFDIYVLESKNYSYKLKISPDGEFEVYYGKEYVGIPSPIEQNKRHIHLLGRFLKYHNILPKRIGISIRPRFKNLILVSPKCIISRPPEKRFDTSSVIKADALRTKIDQEVDKGSPLADLTIISKICSSSTLEATARRLAAFHKPLKVDYKAKFGLPVQSFSNQQKERVSKGGESKKYFCSKCKKPISERVAKSCWQNTAKFGGKAYCVECQDKRMAPS